MTVEELIAELKQWPSDAEVTVGNNPIRYTDAMPYYYDGRLSFVERDNKEKPVKCGWRNSGTKVKLICDDVEDAILDNPEVEIELGSRENDTWAKLWIGQKRIEGHNLQERLKEIRKGREE